MFTFKRRIKYNKRKICKLLLNLLIGYFIYYYFNKEKGSQTFN